MGVFVFEKEHDALEGVLDNHTEDVQYIKRIFYPYWLANLQVIFTLPLLGDRSREASAVVDGLSGNVQLISDEINMKRRSSMRKHSSECVPFVVHKKKIDENHLRRAALAHHSRSMRNWMNISVQVQSYDVLFKELQLYTVKFADTEKRQTVAFDTLTGQYGLISTETEKLAGLAGD